MECGEESWQARSHTRACTHMRITVSSNLHTHAEPRGLSHIKIKTSFDFCLFSIIRTLCQNRVWAMARVLFKIKQMYFLLAKTRRKPKQASPALSKKKKKKLDARESPSLRNFPKRISRLFLDCNHEMKLMHICVSNCHKPATNPSLLTHEQEVKGKNSMKK